VLQLNLRLQFITPSITNVENHIHANSAQHETVLIVTSTWIVFGSDVTPLTHSG
jgi:hypothetical protein